MEEAQGQEFNTSVSIPLTSTSEGVTTISEVPRGIIETCGRCHREKVNGKCPACGRPPDYSDEILTKVIEYLDTQAWKNKYNRSIPSLANLSKYLDVSRETIQTWKKEHKEFSYIVDKVEAGQEEILIENGLNNIFNSNITKLLLAKQGYTDKTEQDITSKGDKIDGLSVSFVKPNE